MSFKINFQPSPAALYFTVSEHLRGYSKQEEIKTVLSHVEFQVRKLFNIPAEFKFQLLNIFEEDLFSEQFKSVIRSDDPIYGINQLVEEGMKIQENSMLDLSFSFPHIPNNYSGFNTICINTNYSLGVPAGFIIVFNRNNSIKFTGYSTDSEEFCKDIYICGQVLNDLISKGIDVLVRESNYKAAVLYQMIDSSKKLKPLSAKEKRSKTMVGVECECGIFSRIEKMGYEFQVQDKGKLVHFTIANYPTHSKELIEMLADRVAAL